MARLTKKLVREAKHGIMKRARELREMTLAEFDAEVKRVNESMGVKITGDRRQLMSFLIADALDRALNDLWLS